MSVHELSFTVNVITNTEFNFIVQDECSNKYMYLLYTDRFLPIDVPAKSSMSYQLPFCSIFIV